jgi:hypothetical protein
MGPDLMLLFAGRICRGRCGVYIVQTPYGNSDKPTLFICIIIFLKR